MAKMYWSLERLAISVTHGRSNSSDERECSRKCGFVLCVSAYFLTDVHTYEYLGVTESTYLIEISTGIT